MPKTVYLYTVGCQMNVLDSELVASELLAAGYQLVHSPRAADVILLNTCSVRQHAEDKIYSALGRLKHAKQSRRQRIIGVLGCMAQKDQAQILRRAPHVDLVLGPGQLGRLREALEEIQNGRGPVVYTSWPRTAGPRAEIARSFATFDPPRRSEVRAVRHQALVRVMSGCDKFCTYCVVPSVRGPEQSRPATQIEAEVRRLAEQGVVEVTLIGQTVNSYHDRSSGRSVRLADLLYRIHDTPGLRRIKFVTNHPSHMDDDLLMAVRDLPKVNPYFHVPAQSGSDRMLKLMKRGYTAAEYWQMLQRIRATVPGAAVTSDFIVGFCGESEEDFQQTVDLVRRARFKNCFIFKYSPRPGTKAAELLADDVPEPVKRLRNNQLLAIQNAISLEDNQALVGQVLEVLVEGPSTLGRKLCGTGTGQLVGRTRCDRIVVFDGRPELAGRIVPVLIQRAEAVTLFGVLADCQPTPPLAACGLCKAQ